MKKAKTLALLLSLAMVLTAAPVNTPAASAAKALKLSKKTVSVKVGQKATVKVKNATKKTKVTWKIANKSIAKISGKTAKGKKAKATVKGISVGSTKLTASYKLGKKTKKLSCKVNVVSDTVATQVPTGPVAPTQAANASAAPVNSPSATSGSSATGTPKPTKTPRITATPSPTPTPKPKAETKPTSRYVDILGTTTVVYNPTRDDDKDKVNNPNLMKKNADGSVTIDYLDTVYFGVRFTFEKPLNLEDYAYLVVEGVNAPGAQDGHQLAAQLLDAVDHNDSHGGLLEIDTVDQFTFPIIMNLADPATRTNVNSFEIYSTDGTNPKGPITINSILLFKNEADYKLYQAGTLPGMPAKATATPTTAPTTAPTEAPTAEPTQAPPRYDNVDTSETLGIQEIEPGRYVLALNYGTHTTGDVPASIAATYGNSGNLACLADTNPTASSQANGKPAVPVIQGAKFIYNENENIVWDIEELPLATPGSGVHIYSLKNVATGQYLAVDGSNITYVDSYDNSTVSKVGFAFVTVDFDDDVKASSSGWEKCGVNRITQLVSIDDNNVLRMAYSKCYFSLYTDDNGRNTNAHLYKLDPTTLPKPSEFKVTYKGDAHVKSFTTYYTQDYTETGVKVENDTNAVARDSVTGEIANDGTGQVNFEVILDEGYVVDQIEITPTSNFNNLKGKSDTLLDNVYRITKVTGDITINVTTKLFEAPTHEGFEATFVIDGGHATVTTYTTGDYADEGKATNQTKTVARNSATGEMLTDGNGQINFTVECEAGYIVTDVSATPKTNYKNKKAGTAEGLKDDNTYRYTKITGDLEITITVVPAGLFQ